MGEIAFSGDSSAVSLQEWQIDGDDLDEAEKEDCPDRVVLPCADGSCGVKDLGGADVEVLCGREELLAECSEK